MAAKRRKKKRLQLITSDQSTPAKSQITKPCSDCPWARKAVEGWLGPGTIDEWLRAAHGEDQVECHVHPNVQCAGLAIFRANVYKSPRDPTTLVLPADRVLVFSWNDEFRAHHDLKWKLMAKIKAKQEERSE